jgi:hypothetical protein
MRSIPLVANIFAALFLSTIGAHADGTWCAQYGTPGGGTNCGSTRSSNAELPFRGLADSACAIHSQHIAARENREGGIGVTVRRIKFRWSPSRSGQCRQE